MDSLHHKRLKDNDAIDFRLGIDSSSLLGTSDALLSRIMDIHTRRIADSLKLETRLTTACGVTVMLIFAGVRVLSLDYVNAHNLTTSRVASRESRDTAHTTHTAESRIDRFSV